MAALMDPLRNTLDHLALDPKAKEDRRYLVSMLRRLGYSDREIQAVLGWEGDGPRVIEVEYEPPSTRPGAGSFTVVDDWDGRDKTLGFSVAREGGDMTTGYGWAAGDGAVAGREMAKARRWATGDDAVDFGWLPEVEFRETEAVADWSPIEETEGDAGWAPWPDHDGEPAEATAAQTAWEDVEPAEPLHGSASDQPALAETGGQWRVIEEEPETAASQTWGENESPWAKTPETAEAAPEDGAAWSASDAAWPEAAEPLAEQAEETEHLAGAQWAEDEAWNESAVEAPAEQVAWTDAETGQWDDASWDDGAQPEPAALDEAGASWDEPAAGEWQDEYAITDAPAGAWSPSDPDAFTFEDFTLYTRMVELSTGRDQRIFFFAKNAPKSGQPCALPPGYMVETNERTGLPFLRRDPDAVAVDVSDWGDDAEAEAATDGALCMAITKAGTQCRKGPRDGSKYCPVHKGWRGPRVE